MNIKINSTNFQAIPIKDVKIKKRINSEYEIFSAKFVEVDINNEEDIKAMKNLANMWEGYSANGTFLNSILLDIMHSYKGNFQNHVYAVTLQNSDYDNLDYKKILGVSEFIVSSPNNRLEYLQTNPLYIKKNGIEKDIKGIGHSIITVLKEISDKSIELVSSKLAIGFYRKNGFRYINYSDQEYIWEKNNKTKNNDNICLHG